MGDKRGKALSVTGGRTVACFVHSPSAGSDVESERGVGSVARPALKRSVVITKRLTVPVVL